MKIYPRHQNEVVAEGNLENPVIHSGSPELQAYLQKLRAMTPDALKAYLRSSSNLFYSLFRCEEAEE